MTKAVHLFSLSDFAHWIGQQKFSSIAILCDENTHKYCLPKLIENVEIEYVSLKIKNGENHKTLRDCEAIWNSLMANGFDRKSLVINLGGGMITDIGGFAAATFKRGISFVNIPTTLLGMVDASIGNKTGVNFNGIKNQIGTFSTPNAILIDSTFLDSLPNSEYYSGLGEVLKYGFIDSPSILNQNFLASRINQSAIENCVSIKHKIVENDPTEHGWRQVLNFGHTLGHALESYSLTTNKPLKHGEAVAWGMLAECFLSKNILGFKELAKTTELITSIYQKPKWFSVIDEHEILRYAKHDKKNVGGQITCTLLKEIGKPVIGTELKDSQLIESIKWLQQV